MPCLSSPTLPCPALPPCTPPLQSLLCSGAQRKGSAGGSEISDVLAYVGTQLRCPSDPQSRSGRSGEQGKQLRSASEKMFPQKSNTKARLGGRGKGRSCLGASLSPRKPVPGLPRG